MNIAKLRMRAVLVVAMTVLLAIFATACSAEEETINTELAYPNNDEIVESMPETAPPVQIEMPEYELTYSGEFQDVIMVNQLEDQSGLEFFVKLSKSEEHIFTLQYNTSEGELVTVLEDAEGNRIPVAFRMAQVPDNLSEDDQLTFFAAQEAVNEIVASLKLK